MYPSFALIAILVAALPGYTVEPQRTRLDTAIKRGVARIEQGSLSYTSNRACFSCHHQMAVPALALARDKGFSISPANWFIQREFTRETFRPHLERIRKGQAIPGANTMAAYALFILEAAGQEPDDTTSGLVEFLIKRQHPDGSWPALTSRPPTEGSPFTNAALALRGLKTYGWSVQTLETSERDAIRKAWEKGRDWLLKSTPDSTEDRAFHLQALVEAEADAKTIARWRGLLVELQRADGGWAQLPSLESDAYATGIVLAALHRAGASPADPAVRRGITYLLDTQKGDGSWLVQTRSRPIQTFFDNGDPGGKSQFISFAATNWAVLALLQVYSR